MKFGQFGDVWPSISVVSAEFGFGVKKKRQKLGSFRPKVAVWPGNQ